MCKFQLQTLNEQLFIYLFLLHFSNALSRRITSSLLQLTQIQLASELWTCTNTLVTFKVSSNPPSPSYMSRKDLNPETETNFLEIHFHYSQMCQRALCTRTKLMNLPSFLPQKPGFFFLISTLKNFYKNLTSFPSLTFLLGINWLAHGHLLMCCVFLPVSLPYKTSTLFSTYTAAVPDFY